MVHLVNRFTLEVTCPNEQQAFDLQKNFTQILQTRVAATVDEICSQYANTEEYIQVDFVEINLGQVSMQSLEKSFDNIFYKKFEEAIINKLSKRPASVRIQSHQQSTTRLLQFFFNTGTLPWWADDADIDLDAAMIDLIENHREKMTSFLSGHRFHKVLWQRAALQFNKEVKNKLVNIFPQLQQAAGAFTDLLKKLVEEAEQTSIAQTASVLDFLIDGVGNFIIANAPEIFAAGSQGGLQQIFINAARQAIKILPASSKQSFESALKKIAGPVTLTQAPNAEFINNKNAEGIIPEKMVVKHAGIILLSAFLKPIFTALQYLDGNEWINKEAQSRAVYLLKYVSTGNEKMFEHQLVLEKLLCGMPVGMPVDKTITLTQKEKDESVLLLQSVIEHWSVLKNTSVNGLRESFLKRDGILISKEDGWLLQVERKTMDVLVDRIPWGFATVHLPWNNYIISTEW